MSRADLVLLAANAVYGTSYVAIRFAVDDIGPVTLAFLRLVIAGAILVPVYLASRSAGPGPPAPADRRTFFWMGFVGFTLALALSHWGLRWSTATNAALLVATEPVALVALSPIVLGERLTRRAGWGTALAVLGATIVVVNGVPGLTVAVAPHWRGDLLLLLSGVCFAAYSLSAARRSAATASRNRTSRGQRRHATIRACRSRSAISRHDRLRGVCSLRLRMLAGAERTTGCPACSTRVAGPSSQSARCPRPRRA